MEKIGHRVMLYDIYGELLNDHQKSVYEDVVLNDLSLSEIAQELGISRQAVHDIIKRCDRILEEYEEKLQLLKRFLQVRKDVQEICAIQSAQTAADYEADRKKTLAIAEKILEEL